MVSRLGEVVNVSGKTIVVKGKKISPSAMGRVVIDKNMKDVGRVVDVFGPVDNPFAKVILFSDKNDFCENVLYLR
ncbi:MAG: H/ACA RNA-protein complex component Gar1 [Candidatus Methanofastidiosa archaeon]|nr:H/ACA RNA-protein complex component Gar1 [Candidatus Methanofastidiosa archaeon]